MCLLVQHSHKAWDVAAGNMRNSTNEKFDLAPAYFDNRYEVFSTIGRGRSGVVYRARRFSPGDTLDLSIPPIALKVLLGIERDPDAAIRRIKREALALLSCKSPSVIRIFDYVAREDTCYLTMEYAKYSDLRRLFDDGKPDLSTVAILKLVQGILEGVRSIHHVGIIHRDLKLENFLLTDDYQVKVADFGVCLLKGERPDIHVVNEVVGTFDYTAPECLKGGKYSYVSDLYSVGVSAFEMFSGRLPTLGTTIKEMLEDKSGGRIRALPGALLEEFPAVQDFFNKALHPEPEKRFQSAEEMMTAINGVIDGTFRGEKLSVGEKLSSFSKNFSLENKVSAETFLQKILPVSFVERVTQKISARVAECFKFLKLSLLCVVMFIGLYFVKDVFQNVTSKKGSVSVAAVMYDTLSTAPAFGRLFDLYSEGRDFNFTIIPAEPGFGLFSLTKEGWEQVIVSYEPLLGGEGVEVKGKGLHVILMPHEISGNSISGSYKNLITGHSGFWTLLASEVRFSDIKSVDVHS